MDLIALGRFALLPKTISIWRRCCARRWSGWAKKISSRSATRARTRCGANFRSGARTSPKRDAFLAETRARADRTPPFEFYAQALTQGRKKLLARLGPETGDAIDEFLSLALAFEARQHAVAGRLPALDLSGGAEVKRDMERGRNEVRVMTVHGAKGLEADIVILPDTTSLPDSPAAKGHLLYTDEGVLFPLSDKTAPEKVKQAKLAAQAETLKEHRRLLYVALTRAKDDSSSAASRTRRASRKVPGISSRSARRTRWGRKSRKATPPSAFTAAPASPRPRARRRARRKRPQFPIGRARRRRRNVHRLG